jgi:hypothetical protein
LFIEGVLYKKDWGGILMLREVYLERVKFGIGQGYTSLSSSCFKIKKTAFKCGIKQLNGLT